MPLDCFIRNTIPTMTGIKPETFLSGIQAAEAETRIGRRLLSLLDIERRNQRDRDAERARSQPRPKHKLGRNQAKRKEATA